MSYSGGADDLPYPMKAITVIRPLPRQAGWHQTFIENSRPILPDAPSDSKVVTTTKIKLEISRSHARCCSQAIDMMVDQKNSGLRNDPPDEFDHGTTNTAGHVTHVGYFGRSTSLCAR